MKAYETKNMQAAFNETATTNHKLHNIIGRAWEACENIDYMVEWSDQNLATIIEALRDNDGDGLADELEAEAIRAYGDTEATMREDASWYEDDWYAWAC